MKKINEYISYISSTEEPLSAEVYFIKGNKKYYIFERRTDKRVRGIFSLDAKWLGEQT